MYADLKKSLSLNDRFRFQRNLFENNAGLMDKTLDELNNLSTLKETLDYLNSRFAWNWENEPAGAFKEILEKRFT
jgi:primosomal protein N''